ncbi:carboxymuconolactone decarboxylase family protein [Micromonospora sp. C31]|uniref:carboxymuconolactone decarboxylase family protein n=1 Tax=Micromonospora sp. C31 TaxID=2824876 RepID=UPI001B3896BD|nr:carboxymuconolactone decarboxylase family protein [Micromonospora sp. C31]MBQ1076553.1 carboxymuconolactone decarboxylase family protein [Micromonospora sp. C31]
MLTHVRHVTPVAPDAAAGPVARVYRQLADDFGVLAPPVLLHSPAPDLLRACWLMLRETLLAEGLVRREAKEVVAAAVSESNRCPYCVEVHGATAAGLLGDAGGWLTAGVGGIGDPRLRALAEWARHSGAASPTRRRPPPFPAEHGPELIGVAVTFHYLNRMVSVFLQDSPLPPAPAGIRAGVRRTAARIMGSLARTGRTPGRSLELLPPAPPEGDLAWAVGQPHVSAAFARADQAVRRAGEAALPAHVRRRILTCLADPPPPEPGGGRWFDAAVAELSPAERPAARLALLTALAPYRVADADVAACRDGGADDAALVAVTAWASLAAARRIGAQLYGDGAGPPPLGVPGADVAGGEETTRAGEA